MMNYNSYEIDLNIKPERGFIDADVNLQYLVKEDNIKEIIFYIHKDLNIEDVVYDDMNTVNVSEDIEEWSPFILESKKISLSFNKPLSKDHKVDISFKYMGYINIVTKYGINRITEDWLEIGLYTPWFPLSEKIDPSIFKVNVNISPNYTVLSSGLVEKSPNGWTIIQDKPQLDCTIIASNKFNCITNVVDNFTINTYYIDKGIKEVANRINKQSIWIFDNYINKFGVSNSDNFFIFIAPREDGGGYCRDGMIVISSDDSLSDSSIKEEIRNFRFIAHELAHLWWLKASTHSWEDWLNESFAEYSSLMATRDRYGEEEFLRLINLYKDKALNLPAIRGIDRSNDKAHDVLYLKGAVILNKLETMIGKESFQHLLNTIHMNKINTTDDFITNLSSVTNQKTANEFSKLLDL